MKMDPVILIDDGAGGGKATLLMNGTNCVRVPIQNHSVARNTPPGKKFSFILYLQCIPPFFNPVKNQDVIIRHSISIYRIVLTVNARSRVHNAAFQDLLLHVLQTSNLNSEHAHRFLCSL